LMRLKSLVIVSNDLIGKVRKPLTMNVPTLKY